MGGVLRSRASEGQEIQKRAAVTSREVAELLNTSPEALSRWRTGRTEPQRIGLIPY